MTKPERPPTVWGKLLWVNPAGPKVELRTHISQRYANHAIADYAKTYGNRYGRYIFEPYEEKA